MHNEIQSLWAAVIWRVFLDTQSYSQCSRESIDYFRDNRADFRQVCDMAGFNPDYVREKLDGIIGRHDDHATGRGNARRAYIADRKIKKAAALFRKQEKIRQLSRLNRLRKKQSSGG